MEKLVLAVVTAFSALSLSHWWVAANLVDQYGIWFLLMVAIMQFWLISSFFQAERTLANELSSQKTTRSMPRILLAIYFFSVCVVGSLLAAHNLIVLGWQLDVWFVTLTESYQLSDFALLVNQQERLIGGLFEQLFWLMLAAGIFFLACYCLFGRHRKIIAPLLSLVTLCSALLFFMLYSWQHDSIFPSYLQDGQLPLLNLLLSSLSIAVESSLAGFGIFFVLRFVAKKNIEQSFLGFSLLIAVFFSLLFSLGGTLMVYTSGDDLSLATDKLLVLAPLYIASLNAGNLTLVLWIFFSIMLIVIKTALLSGACLYVFSRYLLPHFEENKILVPFLIILLAGIWLVVATSIDTSGKFNINVFFHDVFIDFFAYWTPVQLALLCLLAFLQPRVAHSNLLPMPLTSFDWLLRWYYLLLALGCLSLLLYRINVQVFLL